MYILSWCLLQIHTLRQIGRSERGMGLCAFDPFDNSTAVLVSKCRFSDFFLHLQKPNIFSANIRMESKIKGESNITQTQYANDTL